MAFNLQDYETVESRLEKFWKEYPDGRLSTKIEQATDTRYIVSAQLFKTEADPQAWATGLASESISDRGVIQLLHWRMLRLQRSAERLQMQVMQLRAKGLAERK